MYGVDAMRALVDHLGDAPDSFALAASLPLTDPFFRRELLGMRSARQRWDRIADYLGEQLAIARTSQRMRRRGSGML